MRLRSMQKRALVGALLFLTACAGHSSQPTAMATMTGTLEAAGGPATANIRPLSGTVTARGGNVYTVSVGADGHYRLRVQPGSYTVTGHSRAYEGGAATCRATAPVTGIGGKTTTGNVYCQER
jgi:hypothetical protein